MDEIVSMTTPRGGTVTYTFDVHEFGRLQDAVGQTRVPSRVLKTRTVSGRDITPGTDAAAYGNAATGEQTTVESPVRHAHALPHSQLGAVAYTPSVGGDWGVVQRIVEEPHGSGYFELEREDLEFTALPIGTQTHIATYHYTQAKRTIRRGNRTYVTQHTFRPTNFGDFHRPWTTTETGEITQVTTRTYFYGFNAMPTRSEPRILGTLASEDVTVGSETFTRSWQYHAANGLVLAVDLRPEHGVRGGRPRQRRRGGRREGIRHLIRVFVGREHQRVAADPGLGDFARGQHRRHDCVADDQYAHHHVRIRRTRAPDERDAAGRGVHRHVARQHRRRLRSRRAARPSRARG